MCGAGQQLWLSEENGHQLLVFNSSNFLQKIKRNNGIDIQKSFSIVALNFICKKKETKSETTKVQNFTQDELCIMFYSKEAIIISR